MDEGKQVVDGRPIGLVRTRKGELVTLNAGATAAAMEAFEAEAGSLTEAELQGLVAAVVAAAPHLHAECETALDGFQHLPLKNARTVHAHLTRVGPLPPRVTSEQLP